MRIKQSRIRSYQTNAGMIISPPNISMAMQLKNVRVFPTQSLSLSMLTMAMRIKHFRAVVHFGLLFLDSSKKRATQVLNLIESVKSPFATRMTSTMYHALPPVLAM